MDRATPGERNPSPLKEWHGAHTGGRCCPHEDITILPADLPQRQSRIVWVKYLRAQSSKWQAWQWIRHLLAFQGFGAILQSKLLSSHWSRVVTIKPWGTTNINVDNITQLLSHGIRKTLQYAGYLLLLLLLYINNNNNNNNHPAQCWASSSILFTSKSRQWFLLTEYVYLQGIHLYQSKSLLAASTVNRELGNMVSGVWSRFISAQSPHHSVTRMLSCIILTI